MAVRCAGAHRTTATSCRIAGALYHKMQTQSSAPEDGRNYRPKHVELIVIINKICYFCIYLAVYIITSVMHDHTNIKFK